MWDRRFRRILLKREGVAAALWGDAGIGKTFAAQRFLRALPCRSLSVQADQPFTALVHHLPQVGTAPRWAQQSLARVGTGDAIAAGRIVEAIGAALAAAAPIVVHLEDLHAANGARLELLRDLAGTVQRSAGVGLLATSRTEPPEPFERYRAEPLATDEIERMLIQDMGAPLPQPALDWISRRAAGNPLFAQEYLRVLGRRGHVWSDGTRWHWREPERDAIPPTVEALLELSLEEPRRDPLLAQAMSARAYLPFEATAEVWRAVAELSVLEFESAIRELGRRRVFHGADFAHPLYREVVRSGISHRERRELARRALAAYAGDPVRAVVFLADAAPGRDAVRSVLEDAVARARTGNDPRVVAELLARSCDQVTGEEQGRLALAAANAFDGVDFGRMLELAVRAEALLSDPSEAQYLQAVALATAGRHQAMSDVVRRIPEDVKHGAQWLDRYSGLLHRTARHRELIEFFEAHEHRDHHDASTAYRVGWAYLHAGDPDAAAGLVEAWRTRPQADEDRLSLGELEAATAFYGGRYDDASRVYGEILRRMREMGRDNDLDVANVLRNRSVTRLQIAEYRESMHDLERALEIYGRAGHGLYVAQTLVMASYVHLEVGDLDRAEEVLVEALEIFGRTEPQPGLVDCLAQLSSLYLLRSGAVNAFLARKHAREALSVARGLGLGFHYLVASCALSRACTAVGESEEGLVLAEGVLADSKQLGYAEAELAARMAKAEALEALGRVGEARDELVAAHVQARASGLALDEAKLALELDRLDGAEVRASLRLTWFEERGLMTGAALVRRYFPHLDGSRDVPVEAAATALTTTAAGSCIEVLGPMRVRTGKRLEPVRGRKAQTLLALLLEGRMTGRDDVPRMELVDVLYPRVVEAKASNNLKQLVKSLRAQVGARGIRTSGGGYALGDLESDAESFLATADASLWRGPYLQGVEELSRGSVADILYRELAAGAASLIETDGAESARLAFILIEADPYDLDHVQLALAALRSEKSFRALERVYQRARERLAEVGEALPERWTDFLASR